MAATAAEHWAATAATAKVVLLSGGGSGSGPADPVVRLPVLVLAEGAAVLGHLAPGAGLTGRPAAVPADLRYNR